MWQVKDPPHGVTFSVGMKLEAIDPLNLSAICVATVMKVGMLCCFVDRVEIASCSLWADTSDVTCHANFVGLDS